MAKKTNWAIDNAPTTSQVIHQIDRSRKAQELDRLHRATDGALGEALKKEAEPKESPGRLPA